MSIFVSVVIGILLGGGAGWVLGRRAERAVLLFSEDEVEESKPLAIARAVIADRTQKRLNRIMAVAVKEGRITNDGVEELFCISDRTATTYLRFLSEQKRLEKQGYRPRYFLHPNLAFARNLPHKLRAKQFLLFSKTAI
jgi:hypothetical protein